MRYTVLIDNMSVHMKFLAEWGYAGLLETSEGNILLDTGRRGSTLQHNLKALKPFPRVDHIVLSHGHDDHCGGLSEAFRLFPEARIWGSSCLSVERHSGKTPEHTRRNGGLSVTIPETQSVGDSCMIVSGVQAFVVPEEYRNPQWVHSEGLWERGDDGLLHPDSFRDDLSLLVEGKKGVSLLLGCAHTGLPNILQYVREYFGISSLHAVIGGMHLSPVEEAAFPDWMEALHCVSVDVWWPCHCTGFRAAAHLASLFPCVNWAGAGTCFDL